MKDLLIQTFYHHKDQDRSKQMAAYMKDKFPFIGLPKPKRLQLQKDFIKEEKKKKVIDWELVFILWNLEEREFQYLAIDYLVALKKYLQKSDMDKVKELIINKSWWDTVDLLAGNIVGTLCAEYPELIQAYILDWCKSPNIWLVRTAILFQLKYKENTDTELLSFIIETNSASKEFFINKAIGWILREYSKTNKEWVKSFIATHTLAPLSVREGSKYL